MLLILTGIILTIALYKYNKNETRRKVIDSGALVAYNEIADILLLDFPSPSGWKSFLETVLFFESSDKGETVVQWTGMIAFPSGSGLLQTRSSS